MKNQVFITVILLFAFFSATPAGMPGTAPTTQEAFFPQETLTNILEQNGCVAIRIYNAKYPEESAESPMAIGIKEDGSEIYNGLASKSKYQYFEGLDENKAVIDPLNRNRALDACSNLAENLRFNASFSAAEINSMLDVEGTTGLRIVETTSGDNKTFAASSARIVGGKIEQMANAVSVTSTEPCPTLCGDLANYLCR